MSELTILHLSELHFKKEINDDRKIFRQDVQRKLIDTVHEHIKKHEAPDVVAVTGDIAFSGKKQDYDEALFFFSELKNLLPNNTQFLAVPGNHDVDRASVDDFISPYYVVKNQLVDKFIGDREQVIKKINTKFKAFKQFVVILNSELYQSKEDYFWVKNIKDKNVSFLGLNSAWASEGDGDRGNIALGYHQVMTALERSTQPNRVILLHHPIFNWFEERDAKKWSGDVFNKCGLILHGHVHVDSAIIINIPSDSWQCIELLCDTLQCVHRFSAAKRWWQGFTLLFVQFDHLIDDLAKMVENLSFVAAVTAPVEKLGTTAYKTPVFVGPLHNLCILCSRCHFFTSTIPMINRLKKYSTTWNPIGHRTLIRGNHISGIKRKLFYTVWAPTAEMTAG
jgi:predicted MPP superfamily phosphohydrolase